MKTPYGTLCILETSDLLESILSSIKQLNTKTRKPVVALTGGSTPKAFYKWANDNNKLSREDANQVIWTTSDERMVELESEESNFGNAQRTLLAPLGTKDESLLPWPTQLPAKEAAISFSENWKSRFGANQCFDLCFLGMGDDCHTASIFPGSPLVASNTTDLFTDIEVPGKGPRLTITKQGLSTSRKIIITVTGKAKAAALKQVLEGPYDPAQKPAQILKENAHKVTWLIDQEAASELSI